jgi:hypothetical protein
MVNKVFTLTIEQDKEIKDLVDVIANRIYVLDGVASVDCVELSNALGAAPVKATVEPTDNEQEIKPKKSLETKIREFNKMYGLRVADVPDIPFPPGEFIQKLEAFKKILTEEINEIDDVPASTKLDTLVNLADLLCDIQIYCMSEMLKYGIPNGDVLDIIMASNMSKADVNGNPIIDPETGKVLKGPNYWKPEPLIRRLLEATIRQATKS